MTSNSSNNSKAPQFLYFLIKNMNLQKNDFKPRNKDPSSFEGPLISIENVEMVLRALQSLDSSLMSLVIPDPTEVGNVPPTNDGNSMTVQTGKFNLTYFLSDKYNEFMYLLHSNFKPVELHSYQVSKYAVE